MSNENTKIEQSLQDAIDFFNDLKTRNPAQYMHLELREELNARLNKMIDGNAKPTTKGAIKDFVGRYGEAVIELIAPELEEACEQVTILLTNAMKYARFIGIMEDRLATLQGEYRRVEKELSEKEAAFPDPRARCAYELYARASAGEGREDAYTKQRRITAAGLMAAAYLGLTHYEINNAKQPKQE